MPRVCISKKNNWHNWLLKWFTSWYVDKCWSECFASDLRSATLNSCPGLPPCSLLTWDFWMLGTFGDFVANNVWVQQISPSAHEKQQNKPWIQTGSWECQDANLSDRSIILIQIRHTLLKRLPIASRTPSIPPKQVAGLRAPQAFKYTRFHFSSFFNVIAHQNQARFLEKRNPRRSQETQRGRKSKES